MRSAFFFFALGLAVPGCAEESLVVTVDLRTDFVPEDEFALVYTELAREADGAPIDEDLYRPAPSDVFTEGVRVSELRNLSPGPAWLSVRLERLDGAIVAERLVSLELTTSYAATVTIGSLCPTGAEPACGCESDSECDGASVGCLSGSCIDRECLVIPNDAECSDGERCAPSGACEYDGLCTTSCDRPECAGERCDDGDACTYDDVCRDGACSGTPLECTSTGCEVSRCIGTDTCDVRPATEGSPCDDDGSACTTDLCDASGRCVHEPLTGMACDDDANPCTTDLCDDTGTCAHTPLPEGQQWGDIYERCCGGQALRLTTPGNCGQCGATCQRGQLCEFFMGAPTCRCTSSCPYGAVCVTLGGWCACEVDRQCDPEARCQISPGHQYCTYD